MLYEAEFNVMCRAKLQVEAESEEEARRLAREMFTIHDIKEAQEIGHVFLKETNK